MSNVRKQTNKQMAVEKPIRYKCMLGGIITSFENAVEKHISAIFITDCWGSADKVALVMPNKQTISH